MKTNDSILSDDTYRGGQLLDFNGVVDQGERERERDNPTLKSLSGAGGSQAVRWALLFNGGILCSSRE